MSDHYDIGVDTAQGSLTTRFGIATGNLIVPWINTGEEADYRRALHARVCYLKRLGRAKRRRVLRGQRQAMRALWRSTVPYPRRWAVHPALTDLREACHAFRSFRDTPLPANAHPEIFAYFPDKETP